MKVFINPKKGVILYKCDVNNGNNPKMMKELDKMIKKRKRKAEMEELIEKIKEAKKDPEFRAELKRWIEQHTK